MKLTPKREAYALNLFQGQSQREAYVGAGYSSRQSPGTLDTNAYQLAQSNQIVTRLAKLHKEAKEKAQYTVQKRKDRLEKLAEENNAGQYGYSRQPCINAIDVLNKMEKVYGDESPNKDIVVVFNIGRGYINDKGEL